MAKKRDNERAVVGTVPSQFPVFGAARTEDGAGLDGWNREYERSLEALKSEFPQEQPVRADASAQNLFQNLGAMIPGLAKAFQKGAAQTFKPDAAFEATMAPPRKKPKVYTDERQMGPGNYVDLGGGRYARDSDLSSLAQQGDTRAVRQLEQQSYDDARRLANANRAAEGRVMNEVIPSKLTGFTATGAPVYDDAGAVKAMRESERAAAAQANAAEAQDFGAHLSRADAAMMKSLGLGEKAFEQDTARALAAQAEYGQKVLDPQRIANEQERNRLANETNLKIAEMGREGAIHTAHVQRQAQIDDDYTKGIINKEQHQTATAINNQRMQDARAKSGARVPSKAPEQGGPAPAPNEQDLLERNKLAGEETLKNRAFVMDALGGQFDPKTGVLTGGKFDPFAAAAAIRKHGATPKMMEFLREAIKKNVVGDEATNMSKLASAYSRLSQLGGKSEGASPKVKLGRNSHWVYPTIDYTIPDQNAGLEHRLTLTENVPNPIDYMFGPDRPTSSTWWGGLIGGAAVPSWREGYASDASAIADLMQLMAQGGYGVRR